MQGQKRPAGNAKEMSMARRMGFSLASAVRVVTWGAVLCFVVLSIVVDTLDIRSPENPGRIGLLGHILFLLVFFAPFFALLWPLAKRAFARGDELSSRWIVALSPVICVICVFIHALAAVIVRDSDGGKLFVWIFWGMIGLWMWHPHFIRQNPVKGKAEGEIPVENVEK